MANMISKPQGMRPHSHLFPNPFLTTFHNLDELKELVKVSLQQDGVLAKIKAQLRVSFLFWDRFSNSNRVFP
jgi:hypothetical protein